MKPRRPSQSVSSAHSQGSHLPPPIQLVTQQPAPSQSQTTPTDSRQTRRMLLRHPWLCFCLNLNPSSQASPASSSPSAHSKNQFTRWSRHVRLVERCYPPPAAASMVFMDHTQLDLNKNKNPQLHCPHPRPNRLSTLLFYAQSKPQKVDKLGRYLEWRIHSDVIWHRIGYCVVSVEILKELLGVCAKQVHLLCPYLLRIMVDLLSVDYPLLITQTVDMWTHFCRLYHPERVAVDTPILTQLDPLYKRFMKLSMKEVDQEQYRYEYRSGGLRGLQALLMLEPFTGETVRQRMRMLWMAILANISITQPLVLAAGKDKVKKKSSLGDTSLLSGSIELVSLGQLALDCVKQLVSECNSITIRLVMLPMFEYMQQEGLWAQEQYCIDLLERILQEVSKRHGNLILAEALEYYQQHRLTIAVSAPGPASSPQITSSLVKFMQDHLWKA